MEGEKCVECGKKVMIGDDPVRCDGQCGIFHRACTNLTKTQAKLIADNEQFLFKCVKCLSKPKCGETDVAADVKSISDGMKAFISEAIDGIRSNIETQINIAIESGIEKLKLVLNESLREKVELVLDGSVAKKMEEINCKLFEISNRDKVLPVMKRKRDITGRLVHSESDGNPRNKKICLTDKDDEPMKEDTTESEQDNEVFSYAKVLKNGKKQNAKVVKNRTPRPVIVIKPVGSSQTSDDTRKELKKKLDPKIHKVSNFRNGKDGSIIADCATGYDVNTVKADIESNLGGKYSAVIPTATKPKVKILGMTDQYSSEEFVEVLKSQNDDIGITDVKVIAHFENPRFKYNKFNVVLEVDNDTFKCLMCAKKVNIGFDRCSVVEALNILRCFKCGEYGHKSTECPNKDTCSRCSGNHQTSACSSNDFKCVNCLKMNVARKTNLDVNHAAFNTQCPVYQRLYEKRKSNLQFSK